MQGMYQLFVTADTLLLGFNSQLVCAAFWKGWDMTLVILACVPLLGGIGIGFTILFTRTQARGEQAYAAAAALVQETLANIRTVFAFGAEPRMQSRYRQVCAIRAIHSMMHPICLSATGPAGLNGADSAACMPVVLAYAAIWKLSVHFESLQACQYLVA